MEAHGPPLGPGRVLKLNSFAFNWGYVLERSSQAYLHGSSVCSLRNAWVR